MAYDFTWTNDIYYELVHHKDRIERGVPDMTDVELGAFEEAIRDRHDFEWPEQNVQYTRILSAIAVERTRREKVRRRRQLEDALLSIPKKLDLIESHLRNSSLDRDALLEQLETVVGQNADLLQSLDRIREGGDGGDIHDLLRQVKARLYHEDD